MLPPRTSVISVGTKVITLSCALTHTKEERELFHLDSRHSAINARSMDIIRTNALRVVLLLVKHESI
jgi:hypothetical protein